MSTQEKRPLAFLIIDVITFTSYYSMLLFFDERLIQSMGELPFWGASILVLALVMIVFRIVLYVVYSLLNSAITKRKEEAFLTDEFGKIIKLTAVQHFNNTFLFGFLLTMGLLVVGISVSFMFKLLLFSLFAAFIVQNISEYYYTRNGV